MELTNLISQVVPSCVLAVLGYIAKNSMAIKQDVRDIRLKFDSLSEKVDDNKARILRLEEIKLMRNK